MSYQQQYVRLRRIASKTIAIRLYIDFFFCVFSALVNSACRNKATNLEMGFPKILTKNMFSSNLKANYFCTYDKFNLNSGRFKLGDFA